MDLKVSTNDQGNGFTVSWDNKSQKIDGYTVLYSKNASALIEAKTANAAKGVYMKSLNGNTTTFSISSNLMKPFDTWYVKIGPYTMSHTGAPLYNWTSVEPIQIWNRITKNQDVTLEHGTAIQGHNECWPTSVANMLQISPSRLKSLLKQYNCNVDFSDGTNVQEARKVLSCLKEHNHIKDFQELEGTTKLVYGTYYPPEGCEIQTFDNDDYRKMSSYLDNKWYILASTIPIANMGYADYEFNQKDQDGHAILIFGRKARKEPNSQRVDGIYSNYYFQDPNDSSSHKITGAGLGIDFQFRFFHAIKL